MEGVRVWRPSPSIAADLTIMDPQLVLQLLTGLCAVFGFGVGILFWIRD